MAEVNLAVVGVGNAGCRLANWLLEVERSTGRDLSRGNALLINTEPTEFDTRERVPASRRLLIGDVHREVDGTGAGGDPDLGARVAREERHEIIRALDTIEFYDVDGMLVVAGLGRGTGGGAGPVVVEELQSICDGPVYAVAVLPGADEGGHRAMNAARSLQSFVDKADNVIGFDNGAWRQDQGTPDQDYRDVNAALATRVVSLFAAGEFRSNSAAPENRLDPSDMMRTLATGGVSTIGYAETDVGGSRWPLRDWLASFRWPAFLRRSGGEDGEAAEETPQSEALRTNHLVRRATHSKLTLPCEVSSAERALIMLSGPSRALSRKGFESGRYWLEQEADTVDVMAGDEPHERSRQLTATVLLSNVTEVPRIEEMKAQALATQA